jgi:hypothetical protein
MIRRILFSTLSLAAASALFAADKADKFEITLQQAAVVHGTAFKAGDAKVTVQDGKATFTQGKISVEVPVKVETAKDKYFTTRINYKDDHQITEIGVSGTTKKIVIQDSAAGQ